MGKSIWDTRFGKRGIAQDERVQVEEGDSWKTIHGAHVLLGDDGRIKAGAGGKFNGNKPEAYSKRMDFWLGQMYADEMMDDALKKTAREMKKSRNNKFVLKRGTKELMKEGHKFLEKNEYVNPPKVLDSPMSENDAITQIAGGDQTGGSCASVMMAFVANQELGLNVEDFRGGASSAVMSVTYGEPLLEALENGYNPEKEGGEVFFNTGMDTVAIFDALESMYPNKNYIAFIGCHASVVRKLETGELQYLELQGNDNGEERQRNGWHKIADGHNVESYERFNNAGDVLMDRFGIERYLKYNRVCGIIPADRYAQTDYVKNNLQYVNTSEKRQMKGSGGSIK